MTKDIIRVSSVYLSYLHFKVAELNELNVYRSNGNHTVFFRGNFQIKICLEDLSSSEENVMIFML